MTLLDKTEFSESDILDIISSRTEESINIEFKSANALSEDKSAKKEISKDVSAFANSDGGLIIYGIEEKDHVATATSFVDGRKYTKEWLENVVISNIQNRIDGLAIIPVRFGGDIGQSIYVVKIPRSSSSPHINGDKKYYKRFNFQSVPMEEYEVRNSYLRYNESRVVFSELVYIKPSFKESPDFRLILDIIVGNDGTHVAEKYKVGVVITGARGVSMGCPSGFGYNLTNHPEFGTKFSTTKMIPLFPGETLTVLQFYLEIKNSDLVKLIKTIKGKVVIFSLNEIYEESLDLRQLLINIHDDYWSVLGEDGKYRD
jgi:hypothetical protein